MLDFFKRNKLEKNIDNILQAYSQAQSFSTKNIDMADKVSAYNNVISFCAADFGCMNDNSRKRDMVLYWTYNNLGDIFFQQATKNFENKAYADAVENYQRALNFARNSDEKIETLRRLSALYQQNGDDNNFYTVQDTLIESYPVSERREAFENLADKAEGINKKIYFLEKALDFVKSERISALERCKNTVRLCEKLRLYYADKKDYANLARIEELRANTSFLIH